MLADLMMGAILLCAPFALWGALCALNSIELSKTPINIVISFLFIAWGWGMLIFAALDCLVHRAPVFWPKVLLAGVLLLAVGNAILFLANRRECRCSGCPGRRAIRELRCGQPSGMTGDES